MCSTRPGIELWNICSEPSEAPDVEMVEELIEAIQSYDNVNADRIQILGVSNGPRGQQRPHPE